MTLSQRDTLSPGGAAKRQTPVVFVLGSNVAETMYGRERVPGNTVKPPPTRAPAAEAESDARNVVTVAGIGIDADAHMTDSAAAIARCNTSIERNRYGNTTDIIHLGRD